MFVFVKQMTAYELRISDWSATCALPICAYARAVDLPEAEIGAAVRQELEDDEYGSRPLYEAYEPTDPARLPTARVTWTLVIVTLPLASARKSLVAGTSVSVGVDLGVRRCIYKNNRKHNKKEHETY